MVKIFGAKEGWRVKLRDCWPGNIFRNTVVEQEPHNQLPLQSSHKYKYGHLEHDYHSMYQLKGMTRNIVIQNKDCAMVTLPAIHTGQWKSVGGF